MVDEDTVDGGDDEVVRVAEAFGAVARDLRAQPDTASTLQRIVELAVETLDACEFAGITHIVGRTISSPASSNEIPRVLDAIQAEVDEGPCLDAIRDHQVFRTGDLEREERWPRFAHRAHAETGIRSILSVRLFIDGDTMGALNSYSSKRDAFDDTDVALAAVFATHAAVAMTAARRETNLELKAVSRDLIGRAKGILMSQEHLSDDDAFAVLREASQRLNIRLSEVAEQVNYTGERPG